MHLRFLLFQTFSRQPLKKQFCYVNFYNSSLKLSRITIRIGATKHEEGQEIYVSALKAYPGFNIIHKETDLALIKLASILNFSDKVQPVHIRDKNEKDLPAETIVEVIGWGGQTVSLIIVYYVTEL